MAKLYSLTFAVLLAGCAAAPKPALPEQWYTTLPWHTAAIEQCGKAGQIPAELVAWTRNYFPQMLSLYTYDAARLQHAYKSLGDLGTIPATACKEIEIRVLALKQKEDTATIVRGQQQQQEPSPYTFTSTRRTYCNQIGTQTFCSTN